MRQFLTIVLIAAALWGGLKFRDYYRGEMAKSQEKMDGPPRTAPGKLPGLEPSLEPSLEEAKHKGPEGLRDWLKVHRQDVSEPRLTDIELDYVLLSGRTNPSEARRVLNVIKQRIGPDSAAYKRFQQLDKAYP